MDIRFYNTHNLVHPLLDHILVALNKNGYSAKAYISSWKYRSSIQGDDKISYFEKAWITKLSASNKRLNQMLYAIAASFKIIFSKPKLNVFFTQPPLFIIWAAWLSRLRGVPYITHIQDLYPDVIGKLKILDENKSFYKSLDAGMIKAVNQGVCTIVLGACMKNKLLSKKIREDHIHLLKNIPAATNNVTVSNQLDQLEIKAKFVVLYAGNMGMAHEFETILKVAEELSDVSPDIHFLFVAQGRRRELAEKYLEKGYTNLTLINYPLHEVFVSLLQETDLHYITLKHEFEGVMVPCKFYSSLAMGKAILYEGSLNSELAIEINKYHLGSAVEHTNKKALKDKLLLYYENRNLLKEAESNVIEYYKTQCDKDQIVAKYSEILTNAINSKSES